MLFFTVALLLKSALASKLEEFKSFLHMCFPELKPQLSTAESFDSIIEVVREKCTMVNIACLEAIIEYYKITDAQKHIETYKSYVDTFCEKVKLIVCKNENFMTDTSSLLKCETIQFVLGWKTDDRTLKEIRALLWKAFGDMAKRVLVKEAKEGNSIIVICYAPRHIMDALLVEAEKSLDQLRGIGLIKLTIGYHTLWDEHKRDKVRNE